MLISQEKLEREEGANDMKQLLMQRDFELQTKKEECTKLQAQLQALKDATPHKRRLSFASQGSNRDWNTHMCYRVPYGYKILKLKLIFTFSIHFCTRSQISHHTL